MLSARGGLIFEALCAYSKISPLPSLAMSSAEKGGGGLFSGGYVYDMQTSAYKEIISIVAQKLHCLSYFPLSRANTDMQHNT